MAKEDDAAKGPSPSPRPKPAKKAGVEKPEGGSAKLPPWGNMLIGAIVVLIVCGFATLPFSCGKTEEATNKQEPTSATTEQPAEEGSEVAQLKEENQRLKKELAECLNPQPKVAPSMLSGGMATSQPTAKPEPENVPSGKMVLEVDGGYGAWFNRDGAITIGPAVSGSARRTPIVEERRTPRTKGLGESRSLAGMEEPTANPTLSRPTHDL